GNHSVPFQCAILRHTAPFTDVNSPETYRSFPEAAITVIGPGGGCETPLAQRLYSTLGRSDPHASDAKSAGTMQHERRATFTASTLMVAPQSWQYRRATQFLLFSHRHFDSAVAPDLSSNRGQVVDNRGRKGVRGILALFVLIRRYLSLIFPIF